MSVVAENSRPGRRSTSSVAIGWLRANLFNSWYNSLLTVVLVALAAWGIVSLVEWAALGAVWSGASAAACAGAEGACWVVVQQNHRFILFGTYPYFEQWRPMIAVGGFFFAVATLLPIKQARWAVFGLAFLFGAWALDIWREARVFYPLYAELLADGAATTAARAQAVEAAVAVESLGWWTYALALLLAVPIAWPQYGGRGRAIAWIATLTLFPLLMWGGAWIGALYFLDVDWSAARIGFYVPNRDWGGLPITLMLAVVGCVVAFPLSILLALGRRSDMPAIRVVCVTYIELIRGVPLISILFMASVMFPLFLPEGIDVDKLLRAQVGLILFTAAYLAEVIRGGLQAIPKGQYEAADALGLSYWKKTGFIILPQALKIAIPPMVNTFIGVFKDTSLVSIISIFDLLLASRAAFGDFQWRPYFVEVYVFVALIYWAFCYFISKYSQYIERILARDHR